jgi:HK97 family phage major capsid protein
MQEAMSASLDYKFLNGTGVGMPLGIINAPCTVSVAKETSQVAATIVPQNIAKMISRLSPGSFGKAVWLANPTALVQLFQLKMLVTNVAGTENVGGFGPDWFTTAPDGSMSLFGRPLIVTDRCAALGTVGDIVLADLSQYLIAMRQDATLAVDQSIGFKEGEIWFKLTMRVDGQPMLGSAITPRLGGSTLSPFVTLATRS